MPANLKAGFYRSIVYRISTVSYWFHDGGCWFVCVLIPLYLIAPFWNRLLQKIKYPVIPTVLITCVLLFQESSFQDALLQSAFFFPGFWMARYIKNEYNVNWKGILTFILCIVCLLAVYYVLGIGTLLAILTLPFIWISCLVLNLTQKTIINPILKFFGDISLESYILNVTLITWIDYFSLLPESLYPYRYAFIVVFGILLAWGIHTALKPLVNKLSGR